MASPKQFNDPFDANLRVNYDMLTDPQLYDMLYQRFKRYNPTAGHFLAQNSAQQAFERLRNQEHLDLMHDRLYESTAEYIGVYSLAKEPDNILLWSHYANSHAGFAVGYDSDLLFEDVSGLIGEVSYQDQYPSIEPARNDEEEINEMIQAVMTKSSLWSYENEVRLCKPAAARNAYVVRPETIREVIIGAKTPPDHKREIIAAAAGLPQVTVYQAAINRNSFALDLAPVQV